jgi:hypothetical protein
VSIDWTHLKRETSYSYCMSMFEKFLSSSLAQNTSTAETQTNWEKVQTKDKLFPVFLHYPHTHTHVSWFVREKVDPILSTFTRNGETHCHCGYEWWWCAIDYLVQLSFIICVFIFSRFNLKRNEWRKKLIKNLFYAHFLLSSFQLRLCVSVFSTFIFHGQNNSGKKKLFIKTFSQLFFVFIWKTSSSSSVIV